MAAVAAHLAIRLVSKNPPADGFPLTGRSEFGQDASPEVEGQSLAKQMRVGAEVRGQMSSYMVELSIEPEQHVDEPGRIVGFGVERDEEMQTPDP